MHLPYANLSMQVESVGSSRLSSQEALSRRTTSRARREILNVPLLLAPDVKTASRRQNSAAADPAPAPRRLLSSGPMADLDFPRMIAEALLGVARRALAEVAETGFPGEHHFFLTFRTDAEGVEVPPGLRQRYPEEMTVILQHQYWDLTVDDDAFAVTLAFGGPRHRLRVPFTALTGFADPAAQLALRFGGETPAAPSADEPLPEGAAPEPAEGPERPGGEVVSIDRFRKARPPADPTEAGGDGGDGGDVG